MLKQNDIEALVNTDSVNTRSEASQINSRIAVSWNPQDTNSDADNRRQFHSVKESPYILPADVDEQERLVLQHKLVTFGFGRLFHFPLEEDLKSKSLKVLDCGCGPGAWGKELAETYPKATVVGVDMTKLVQSDSPQLANWSFVEANVLVKLPFEDNTFDAVYQRFLIAGIPKDNWASVIKELVRVTKPGGYIEIVESVIKSFQAGPNISRIIDPFAQSLTARGMDVEVGLNVKSYMLEAGLEISGEYIQSTPVGWGGRLGELQLINVMQGINSIKPFFSKVLNVSDKEYDEIVKAAQEEFPKYKTYGNIYSVVGVVTK